MNTLTKSKNEMQVTSGVGVTIAKSLLLKKLKQLQQGYLSLQIGGENFHFGDINAKPRACLQINNPKFFRLCFWSGHLGVAEAYAKGYWQCDDLTALLEIFALNLKTTDELESGWARLASFFQEAFYKLQANTIKGARKNISAHYDLSNKLFSTFLDPRMQYSSAIYPSPNSSLAEAQEFKLKTICERLQLQASDHLLEIGSGWGGLATYAAQRYGCRVTTITISQEQYDYTQKLIAALKLQDLVTVELRDYRDIQQHYDKVVSIEMIEAVGSEFYDEYFRVCRQALKPGGKLLMQAILIADKRYEKAKTEVDFIKRYIFPGSCIPALSVLLQHGSQHDLQLSSYHQFGQDYARTLLIWQDNFNHNSHKLKHLGFDSYFQRLWHFYFSYCAAGFRQGNITCGHLLFQA